MEDKETLVIKPYEPINDLALAEMVSSNLKFQFSARMSVEGTVAYYGWLKITIFYLLLQIL